MTLADAVMRVNTLIERMGDKLPSDDFVALRMVERAANGVAKVLDQQAAALVAENMTGVRKLEAGEP